VINLSHDLSPASIDRKLTRFWEASAAKIEAVEASFDPAQGAPVYTVEGRYTTRGWTEWTQGFQYGSAILQFDATGSEEFLRAGRAMTVNRMAPHVTHRGVHDHGFNNVSTYGNLLRLMNEGRVAEEPWERAFYEMALKVSGAVQAMRWTALPDGEGYVYSFNGPHSLFSDTIRSMRALAVAHDLGHILMDEGDRRVSLLGRAIAHARTTARYNVYYGKERDGYDVRGRVVHESIFNLNDGQYRCPSTQQGYTPFSTWTRGLAWVMCGFAEQLEWIERLRDEALEPWGGRGEVEKMLLDAAQASCDFFIENTPVCGVPYWDTGAPGLHRLGDYLDRPADPYNSEEPVDSSAAVIAAQGLLRLGHFLQRRDGLAAEGGRYWKAGLKVCETVFDDPYLSTDPAHQGLVLHSVYHWPNRWDHVPKGQKVAAGESTMWGDYHARELALYIHRIAADGPYHAFYNAVSAPPAAAH
jgi:unsaturated chondroitin disaccharide hydrolase